MAADDPFRDKRVELILQQLEQLPTLPVVAVRLLEMTAGRAASAQQVGQLLESDPAFASKILSMANRADLGVRQPVQSVDRAVVLLGFDAVRCALLAMGVFESFSSISPNAASHFNREEFWKHSLAVGCGAELLAEQLGEAACNPSEAFLCGLLHDLGKAALDAMLPKSFDRVVEAADLLRGNIADLERSVIGLDHMVVGKRLAERWNLPAIIRDVVWLHGQMPDALPAAVENPRLVNLVTLADSLARRQHVGYSGNYVEEPTPEALAAMLNITPQQLEKTQKELIGRIEPRTQMLGLGRADAGELYLQALNRANQELGRVSGQLAQKNRRLAVRARFFDALSAFQSDLRPDAGPQLVLEAIGQTAVGLLSAGSCAVFSLPPRLTYAEVILFDANGESFQKTLVDCAARPPAGGPGPVRTGGEELQWLLEAISPQLGHDQRYWISLEAEGSCIGGVVWGAMRGESERLGAQVNELSAISAGWALALRTAQIRDESKLLSEQLADANRCLHEAQGEVLRARTLVSVGEMAAGAAHEMNNPLMVISGRSQLLSGQLSEPRQKHAAAQIYEHAQRLSHIITELMDFARPAAPNPVHCDLADLVGKALHEAKMADDPADRTIELTLSELPPVRVDAAQITAAIGQVIANALQATSATGKIQLHAAVEPQGRLVVLTISDDGCGMDTQTVKKAFDPFYSAKPAGRRRGLGLAKALRWIECNGGTIRLQSRVGQGTRVVMQLPVDLPSD